MAITAATRSDIIELVVLATGGAPGVTLLSQLVADIEGGKTLNDVAKTLTTTAAFTKIYPSFATAEEFAAEFLERVLPGITAEAKAAGVTVIAGLMNGGATKADIFLASADFLSNTAATDPVFGTYAGLFQNQVAVATYHTITLELDTGLDTALAGVTSDAATVTTAKTTLDETPPPALPANTFTLTTGADSASVVGGSGDDLYVGTIGTNNLIANGTTLNPGDNLNGGSGTDTLNVSVSGTDTGPVTVTAFITSFLEKILIANYETSTNLTTFDLSGSAGVTTVGFAGSSDTGDTAFTNVANIVDVAMTNSNGDLTVTYPSAMAGLTDTQKVTLSGTGTTTAGAAAVLTVNGAETFALTASTASKIGQVTSNTATAVTVAGKGSLAIATALDSTVASVDASASSGGVTLTLNDAAKNVNYIGGSGNDVLITGNDLTVSDTLVGGAGTDTIAISQSADLVTGNKISGFEILRAVEAGGSYDLTFLPGITEVDYNVAGNGASGVSNAAAGTAVRVSATATTVTHGVKDATLLGSTADSVAVTLKTSATTPTDVSVTSLAIDGVETLSVASEGAVLTGGNTISGIAQATNDVLSTITLTGASKLTLTTGTHAKLATIDGSAMTGALVVTNGSSLTAATVIKGGAGNDSITGRATNDNIDAGAGDDTISGGNGSNTLTGGAGNDSITGGTGTDVVTGGAGNDTINSGSGNDNIDGGDGDDAITFSLTETAGVATSGLNASDKLDGGAGTDTITFNGALANNSTLDLGSTTDTTFAGVSNVEALVLDTTGAGALTVTVGDIFLGSFNNNVTFKSGVNQAQTVNINAGSVLNSASVINFTGVTGKAANYTVGNGKDNVTFSTGADTLTVVTPTFLQAGDVLTGGTGTDTFSVGNTATTDVAITSAQLAALSSFETWTVDSSAAAAATAVTLTLTEDIAIANANTTTNALTISRATSDTGAFTLNASALVTRHVSVTGGNGNDVLTGGGGNDSLSGGDGVDKLTGGAGNDEFTETSLSIGETYDGGDGTDVLTVNASLQSLTGVTLTAIEEVRISNNSTLNARADALSTLKFGHAATTDTGNVTLNIDLSGSSSPNLSGITAGRAGTSASDIRATYINTNTASAFNASLSGLSDDFTGSSLADIINGNAGNDTLVGGAAADTIDGGAGNDSIDGGAGVDSINGGSGNDRITFDSAAQDTVIGGSGTDTLVITGATAVSFDLTQLTGTITGFETVDASAMTANGITTTVTTSSSSTTAFTITGSTFVDTITTAAGADTIFMDPTGTGLVFDVLAAGDGSDTLVMTGSVVTSATLAENFVNLTLPGDQLTANNAAGNSQSGFENVDLLAVTPITNANGFVITAHSGGSSISGTTLADSISGGAGNDIIYGFSGADTIIGGDGNADTLVLINGTANTGAFTGANVLTNAASITTDANLATVEIITVKGSSSMTLTLTGQTEAFTISASTATAGQTIVGGNANDSITGSSLADTITGGAGVDSITGGAGADSIVFATADVDTTAGAVTDIIVGFATTSDKITVGFGAGSGTNYTEVLTAAASLAALLTAADAALTGAVKYYFGVVGSDGYLVTDNNATGYTDVIQLTGVTDMAFGDIIA